MSEEQVRKSAAMMYAVIALLVIWCGFYFINDCVNLVSIDDKSFHISLILVSTALMVFMAIMIYAGQLVESMIAVMMYPSICGYSVAYLLDCLEFGTTIDIVVVAVCALLALALVGDKGRRLVAIGCIFLIAASTATILYPEDGIFVLKGTLMILGGCSLALHCGFELHDIEKGIASDITAHRAKSPTAVCETIGLTVLGIGIIFELSLDNFSGTNTLLPVIIMASMILIAMGVAVFASVNGSISTGTAIIVISLYILITSVITWHSSVSIPENIRFLLAVPLLFVAVRYRRKGDSLLMSSVLLFIIGILFDFIGTNTSVESFVHVSDVIEFIVALMFIYAGVARMNYICLDTKHLPLFDNGSFVNEEWNPERHRSELRSSMAINSFMMASIAMIFLGLDTLNNIYNLTAIDEKMFEIALLIISGFTLLFSIDNLRRGQITEFIALVSISVYAFSFAACGLYAIPLNSGLDSVLAFSLLVSGVILFFRRDKWIGGAMIVASLGFIANAFFTDDSLRIISGILLILAGIDVFLIYNYVKVTTKEKNPSMGAHNLDRLASSYSTETVGLLFLGMAILLLAFSRFDDLKCIFITAVLCGITLALSTYGMICGRLLYNLPVFGITLLVFVMNVTILCTGFIAFEFIRLVFIVLLSALAVVYFHRGDYVFFVIMGLIVIGFVLEIFIDWTVIPQSFVAVSGIVLCLVCLYRWMVDEGLIHENKMIERWAYGN